MSNVPNNNPPAPDNTAAVNTATGKLALGWALVGVPLAYGVYETLTRVAALFG